MKIKNQFLISIVTFSIVLTIIVASVIITETQTALLNSQESTAQKIQTGASNLNYISNYYFLHQDNTSISQWKTQYATLMADLSKLNSTDLQQQALVNNANTDLQHLNTVFNGVVSFLETAPRNVSVRVLPQFQTDWSRIAAQVQALTFDAQQLSQTIRDKVDQSSLTNIGLIVAFLGAFGAYFVTNYLITYRRTLKSISELQAGIAVIGSGNLDYTLKADKKDEVGELSQAFNQMTTNLKTVTASKTELEQAQASLRESEQRWATTLASIGDAVIATGTSGKITFMNYEAEELTGWKLNEAAQKPVKTVFNIINEQSRLEVENPIDRVLKEGAVVGLANHTVLTRKDGTEVPIDDSGAPIKDKDGKTTGVVLIFRNISERKENEEKLEEYRKNLEKLVDERTKQLKDAERLAAIGATAGMVGHDIRNPLQAITSDVFLVKSDLSVVPEGEEKEGIMESLEGIEKNVSYINKIVQDLQDYARPLTPKLEEVDLEKTVHSVLASINIPGNITVKHIIGNNFPKLQVDQSYILRILTNLANNAIQAMPNGGKLTIKAAKENGNKAKITVEDNGEGIPENVRSKLFTPLVTTKSKGQGFGLAVVKRFTEAMGGTVTFESEVGKGTKFIIELPV